MIDWNEIAALLGGIHANAKGEAAWPPLAMFRALLLSVWYDLSDIKLAEALDDRTSFRRFCGFSGTEATPERTAFVRFRKALIAHRLDRLLFERVAAQLKAKAIMVKTGTLVDAPIIASASEEDSDARWVKHKPVLSAVEGGKPAVHGFAAKYMRNGSAILCGDRHRCSVGLNIAADADRLARDMGCEVGDHEGGHVRYFCHLHHGMHRDVMQRKLQIGFRRDPASLRLFGHDAFGARPIDKPW